MIREHGLSGLAAPALTALALAVSAAVPGVAAEGEPRQVLAAEMPPDRLTEVEEDGILLLRLELGRYLLAEALEGYSDFRGGLCLDLAQFAAALDFPIDVDVEAQRASGWFLSEDNRFELTARAVRYGGGSEAVEGADLKLSASGLCVGAEAAERWFGLDIDWIKRESRILVKSDRKLPLEKRIEREQRRERFDLASRFGEDLSDIEAYSEPHEIWRTPSLDLVASAGATGNVRRGETDGFVRYNVYAAGEAARLSYDAQLGSDRDGKPASLRVRGYRRDPAGGLLGPLGATEFAIGDVRLSQSGFATAPAAGRGAYITNAPLYRPQEFDRTSFFGELPPGWDAELYRNGALIGFGLPTGDGRYAFEDVQLLFGGNLFEIVLHGPQGQERRIRRRVMVGPGNARPGETIYRAGVVEDGQDLVTLRDMSGTRRLQAFTAVEHGLSQRTSLGFEIVHGENDREKSVTYMVGTVRQAVPQALLEFDFGSDFDDGYVFAARGSTTIAGISIFASSAFFDNFDAIKIDSDMQAEHEMTANFALGGFASIGASARRRQLAGGRTDDRATARLSTRIAGLSATQQLEYDRIDRNFDSDKRIRTQTLLGGRIGDVALRGVAEFELSPSSKFSRAQVQATYPLSERASLRAAVEHDRGAGDTRFSAGYAHRFDRFALGVDTEISTSGNAAVGVNLAISFGPGAHGRFARVTSHKLAARPQVAARVFSDLNDDGTYQRGEPLHPNIRLKAGGRAGIAETGEDGVAFVTRLQSDEKVRLTVDRASIEDPYLLPPQGGRVIQPRRGILTAIDLPLAPTGEVEGILYLGAEQPLGGAGLELRNDDGEVVAVTQSDYDGFFLFEQVRYGRYTLGLDADSAAQIGAVISEGEAAPLAAVELSEAAPIANAGNISLDVGAGSNIARGDSPEDADGA